MAFTFKKLRFYSNLSCAYFQRSQFHLDMASTIIYYYTRGTIYNYIEFDSNDSEDVIEK